MPRHRQEEGVTSSAPGAWATEVLSCLLDDIQNGVYQVGQKLPSERELMDEFGVGRPAVRDSPLRAGSYGAY